jgi:endonuclease/exonuclease/phosphatase family metal-dependent hydrolase
MSDLRLLTYNIRALRDDADAVSEVIRACGADVVCIQEAPRFFRWRSKRAAIARKAGLLVATANQPAGLMLMVSMRTRVLATHFTLLSKRPQLHQRAVCAAAVEVGGAQWHVASVHLSLDAAERQEHLPELWSALEVRGDGPLVVAGDVNEEPHGAVWRELSTRLVDAWAVDSDGAGHTYSAASPRKRIDGIFVDKGVEVIECRVVDDVPGVDVASDHLPVLAVLRRQSPAHDA